LMVFSAGTMGQTDLNTIKLQRLEAEKALIEAGQGNNQTSDESPDNPFVKKVKNVSFQKNIRLVDALRILSEMYKVNIIPSQMIVEERSLIPVTNLYDVTFEDILKALCGGAHVYVMDKNVVRVYTKQEYTEIKKANLPKALELMEKTEKVWSAASGLIDKDIDAAFTAMEAGLPYIQELETRGRAVDIETSVNAFTALYRKVMQQIKEADIGTRHNLIKLLGDMGNNLQSSIEDHLGELDS